MREARAFPGTLAAASEAEAWARGLCEQGSRLCEQAYAVSLCLEELFVNAVRHGRARRISIALGDDGLEFRDDGQPFDPTAPPPPRPEGGGIEIGGFGVALVQRFATNLAYRRDEGWNVVTLAFAQRPRGTDVV